MKKIKKLSVIFILVGVVVFTALETLIIIGSNTEKTIKRADVAIILGCKVYGESPTVLLRRRIATGLKLYKRGLVKHIIASGGQGPGENISEAEGIKRYLVQRGVPESAIYKEDKSINTMQNLQYSKNIMQDKSLRTAIIVTNPFHIYRSLKIARDLKIDAQGAPSGMEGIDVWCYINTFSREAVSVLKYYTVKSMNTVIALCGSHNSGELNRDTSINISNEDKDAVSTIFRLAKLVEEKKPKEYIKLISSKSVKYINGRNDIISKALLLNDYVESVKIKEAKFLNYIPQNNKKQEYDVKIDMKFKGIPDTLNLVGMYLNKFKYVTMIKENEGWRIDSISSAP